MQGCQQKYNKSNTEFNQISFVGDKKMIHVYEMVLTNKASIRKRLK